MREVSEQEAILKRQVRRARKYKKLEREIKNIEMDLIAGKLATLEINKSELDEQYNNSKMKLQQVSTRLAEIGAKIQKQIATRNEIETKRDQLLQRYRKVDIQISQNEQEIAVLKERVKNAEQTVENSETTYSQINETIRKAEEDKREAEEMLELNQKRLHQVETEIEKLENE